MKKTAKAYPGGKEAKIHNPSGRGVLLTIGLPKEGNKMANTKKKANKAKRKGGSKKSKKKHNTAKSASSSSPKTKKANPAKKRAGSKKNSAKRALRNPLRNPLPGLGDVSIQDWGVFALFAIGSPTVAGLLAAPGGWANIGIQFGITALTAYGAPKSIKTPATFGAGGPAVVTFVNKVTNNWISSFIQRTIGPIIPAGLLGTGAAAGPTPAQLAAANANAGNMAGYRRRYQPSLGY
jgi:hypothetical protein